MSCWVVPTVAADFWGVTLDVVWRRIYHGLVPHKFEDGFVFLDVDPWRTDEEGNRAHEPPPTFVAPGDACSMIEGITAEVNDLIDQLPAPSQHTISDLELLAMDHGGGESSEEESEESLPELDEEEEATFGRLSWQDVRQQVSRTRKPPPRN